MRPRLHTNAIMLQFYSCMQIRDTHQIGRALCVGCEKVGVRTDSEWYELGEHRGLGRITTVCRAGGAEIAAHGRAQIIQGVQQAVGLVVRDWKPRLSQAYGSGLEETPHREAVHLEAVCASFLGGCARSRAGILLWRVVGASNRERLSLGVHEDAPLPPTVRVGLRRVANLMRV